jgi:hypothetical protein
MVWRRLAGLLAAMASDGSTERCFARGQGRSRRSDRGQSELVGTVLILGLSMTVIGTSVMFGGVALDGLVSTAEANNVENGMSHLSSKISLVALGDADSQRFSLGLMQEGSVSVQPDAGRITISNVTNDSRTELFDSDLGAIVYSGGSREVAYQGGGIWSKRDGTSSLASPPEYYYRGTTLTFPIIQVTGEGTVGGQPSGRITPDGVATNAVPTVETPLENGTIEVKIESEYYEGWHEYLTQRSEGDTQIFHSNKTVVSTLTVPDEVTFDNTALSVQESYDADGNTDIDGEINDNVVHRSADSLIESKIADAKADPDVDSGCLNDTAGTCDLSAGTYFVDGDLTQEENIDIETSSGNVTIIVNGTMDIGGNKVTVTDSSTNGTEYYIKGSFRANSKNAYIGTANSGAEADRNILFIGDQFLDESNGNAGTYEAIIYAPDADVTSNGNAEITGSIVANSLDVGGNIDITYDSSVDGTTLLIAGGNDLLTYLHVSHNTVRVDLN